MNANELAKCVNILLNDHLYYRGVSTCCKEIAKMFDILILDERYMNIYYYVLK